MTFESRTLSRREVMALLGGAVVTITACGGNSPSSPSNGGGTSGDKSGVISGNHGHTASIDSGRLQAGNALDLDIRGSATHPHQVSLGASEVVQIRNGDRVSKTSSNDDGHTHQVTFN
jgi:hypothetical protein